MMTESKVPISGVDFLIAAAAEAGVPESVQTAFQEIALGRNTALWDLNRSMREQLKDYEGTALMIFDTAIRVAERMGERQSVLEVLARSCRLATRWRRYLEVTGHPEFGSQS
jgi:hypothetical protein